MRRAALVGAALLLLGAGSERFERPPDPDFPWQWSLESRGQPRGRRDPRPAQADADIDAVEAWAAGYTGEGVTLALIGLGFDYVGSTLEEHLWRNPGEIPGNGKDDDGNGWTDDIVGIDFGEHDVDPSQSESEHDLEISEIALAPHDRRSIAGVAPGARLILLKVADDRGRMLTGPLPLALRYAHSHGARVIFMPWTLPGEGCGDPELAPLSQLVNEIATQVLIVGGRPGEWPACLPGVVSVQPTDAEDWPRQNPTPDIDFAVPGSDGRRGVSNSAAIGLLAGAAALLFEQDPDRTPSEVRDRLKATADRVHPELASYFEGRNEHFGAGRINLARALGTDFDGDGLPDADDPDADGDALPDFGDPCPLDPDPTCSGER